MRASCLHDETCSFCTNTGDAQKLFKGRFVDINREEVQMVKCPIRLRINIGFQEGVGFVDYLSHVELIEAQQPICLIKAMLAIELDGVVLRQARIGVHGKISAEKQRGKDFLSPSQSVKKERLELGFF